jgi:Ca2+-dependent lipid-binding protein
VFGPDLNLENQFTANINYGELKSKGGLTFEVKDWDRIGSNDVIGLLTVSPEKLMELAAASSGSSEATELQLQTPPKRKEPNAGFLTIRVVQQNAAGAGAGAGSSGSTTPASSRSIHSGEVPFPPSPPSQTSQSKEAPLSLVVEEKAPPSTSKELLIEIISCREIPAADKNGTSDPYVKIKLGGKEVHKTSHIEKTLNPAFSSTHKNLYIIKCSAKELYAKEGIELVVKDYDKGLGALGFGSDDLGSVKVSGAQLYNAPEDQDMELPLIPYKKKDGTSASPTAGFITIRVREATLGDKDAIKEQNSFFSNVKSKILTSPRQVCVHGTCLFL